MTADGCSGSASAASRAESLRASLAGTRKASARGAPGNNLSCAELLAVNQQGFDVNASVVVEASKFLTGLLLTHDLRRYAAEINVTSGVVRSSYTDPAEIARVIKKPVGFLTRKPLNEPAEVDGADGLGEALAELLADVRGAEV